MASYTGKYAAVDSPVVGPKQAGVMMFLEATIGFNSATTPQTILNTGGTLDVFKLPPYARLIDVQMCNDAIGTGNAQATFNGHLMLYLRTSSGTVISSGSLIIGQTAHWNASTTGLRSLRANSILLDATDAMGAYSQATVSASAVRSIYTGGSAIFNVAATEKYVSLIVDSTATLAALGELAATPAYMYFACQYRSCDPVVDDTYPS